MYYTILAKNTDWCYYALLLKANTAALTITAENATRKRASTEIGCRERLFKILLAT
jgi:hypothetical protein